MKRLAASFVSIDETDEQGRVSHARVKFLENFEVLREKTRFEDQILRWISRDGQLRGQNQLRAGSSKALVSANDFLKIAAQIPDSRGNLSKTNLHAALGQIMRNTAGSNALLFALIQRRLFAAGFDGRDVREIGRHLVCLKGFHVHFD